MLKVHQPKPGNQLLSKAEGIQAFLKVSFLREACCFQGSDASGGSWTAGLIIIIPFFGLDPIS